MCRCPTPPSFFISNPLLHNGITSFWILFRRLCFPSKSRTSASELDDRTSFFDDSTTARVCFEICLFVGLFQKPQVTTYRHYSNHRLYINSTLTVSAVSLTHSGKYTCTAVNEAGVATATTELRVLGENIWLKRKIITREQDNNSCEQDNNSCEQDNKHEDGQTECKMILTVPPLPPLRHQMLPT